MSAHTVRWRRRAVSPVLVAVGTVLIVIFGCSDPTCPPKEPEAFEVHEWGVMVGCREDTSFFLTSRPEVPLEVDIPVLYFHSTEQKPFTAKVRFSDGWPTDTYPEAAVSADSAVWSNVRFSQGDVAAVDSTTDDYVPLEHIIDTLNDVDADLLEYGNTRTRFLFYEGRASFRNEITASYSFVEGEATLKNRADYPCYNLILVATKEGGLPWDPHYFAEISVLNPGQERTVKFGTRTPYPITLSDLLSLGFTSSEASSFSGLWEPPFFDKGDSEAWTNLIYRLPQAKYDELISLEIEPEPDEIIRAMYVLVHLSE